MKYLAAEDPRTAQITNILLGVIGAMGTLVSVAFVLWLATVVTL